MVLPDESKYRRLAEDSVGYGRSPATLERGKSIRNDYEEGEDMSMSWYHIAILIGGVVLFKLFFIAISLFVQSRSLMWFAEKQWPRVLWRMSPSVEKVVALTIDDAIGHWTSDYLDLLEANNCTATFMTMGETLNGTHRMQLQRRIWDIGCETGNHLMRDYPSIKLHITEFERQLKETDLRLFEVNGLPRPRFKWLRPASGWFNDEMLDVIEANGYKCVLGDIYPWDAQIKKTGFIRWFVNQRLHDGGIIIVHDREASYKAMAEFIPAAIKKGWRFMSLSRYVELQEARGLLATPDASTPLASEL